MVHHKNVSLLWRTNGSLLSCPDKEDRWIQTESYSRMLFVQAWQNPPNYLNYIRNFTEWFVPSRSCYILLLFLYTTQNVESDANIYHFSGDECYFTIDLFDSIVMQIKNCKVKIYNILTLLIKKNTHKIKQ